MSEIRQVNIDSKDRDPDSFSREHFWIDIPVNIDRVKKVELYSVEIPYSFYAITGNNNILRYTFSNDQSNVLNIQIPYGNYTASRFVETLNSMLNGITVIYDRETQKLNFSAVVAFRLDPSSPIAYILGIDSSEIINYVLNYTPSHVINITGPRYLCINSSALVKPLLYKPLIRNDNNYDALCKIDISAPPGGYILEKNILSMPLKFGVYQKISKIDLQLTDEFGNIIDLNGKDWSVTVNFVIG